MTSIPIDPPKVKICGVRTPEEALLAAELGADLIGLNFHPPSPRYLDRGAAREIVLALPSGQRPLVAGVFVHHSAAEAAEIGDAIGLDLLQLHGDHLPEEVAPFAGRTLIALRIEGRPVKEDLDPWRRIGVWGLVLDTRHQALYGGTGQGWNYGAAAGLALPGERLLIAGGLDAGNVAVAFRASRAWGVDLCSGLESAPGVRDPDRLRALFATLESAFPST